MVAIAPPRDKVKCVTTTAGGQGTSIFLGQAASNLFLTPAEAGMVDGETYEYVIEQGNDWEHNSGIYSASANSIQRGIPIRSRITGAFGTTKVTMDLSALVYFPHTENTLYSVGPGGHCQLVGTSTTSIALYPMTGRFLWINRRPEVVPAVGVAISNTGLAANTLYNVYAYMATVSTMALELSTTAPVIDSLTGMPVKTGDVTRSFVGAVLTSNNTPGQFLFSGDKGWGMLRSWFNDYGFCAYGTPSEVSGGAGLTFAGQINWFGTEFPVSSRVAYIAWQDELLWHSFNALTWTMAGIGFGGFGVGINGPGASLITPASAAIITGCWAGCTMQTPTGNWQQLWGAGGRRYNQSGLAQSYSANMRATNVDAGTTWTCAGSDYSVDASHHFVASQGKAYGTGLAF